MLTQVLTTTLDERGHGWNHRVRNKNTTRSEVTADRLWATVILSRCVARYTPFSRKEGDEH